MAASRSRALWTIAFFVCLLLLSQSQSLRSGPAASVAASGDPVIAAAGDIACDPTNGVFNGGNGTSNACRQAATSDLLVNKGYAAVLPLGDDQYYCGGYQAFLGSYDPSWGRVKNITHPTPGNHEYLTSGGTDCTSANAGAAGYFHYFGAAAGTAGQGWYSYDVGAWHIIVLNSNCSDVGGCAVGTPQYKWLLSDLSAHQASCTLAYWHIPLFSSGGRAAANSKTFWQALYDAGADVILNGHDHIYERFAPQAPTGAPDTVRGIREFIVGTGGADHTTLVTTAANSQVRESSTYGVLELTLHSNSYDWRFVPEAGKTFTDSGSASCHNAASTATPGPPTATSTSSPSPTSTPVSPTTTGTPTPTSTPAGTGVVFSDGFESGALSAWTSVAGLAVSAQDAHTGTWSARATSADGSGTAFAYVQLAAPQPDLTSSLWFKIVSLGPNVVDIMKLRTATGTALLTLFASQTGVLGYQNNVTTASTYSTAPVSTGDWHHLEVRVVIAGTTSTTQTWLDGQLVSALSKTESLGTTATGRVQIGENITGRTYDLALDDVSLIGGR